MMYLQSVAAILLSAGVSLTLAACASGPRPHWQACDERAIEKGYTLDDLYTGGPSNQDTGQGNRIYGKGNQVSGDDNCIIGEDNLIRGNRNTVTGSRNQI